MSDAAIRAELQITVKDGTAAGVQAAVRTAERAAEQVASATEKAARKAAEAVEQSETRQRTSYEKASLAREQLGLRSEHAIQREIQRTEAAYQRLAQAGFASAQEQERAYAAMQARVTSLTNEMGKLTAAQQRAAEEARRLEQIEADRARGQKVLRTGAAVVAGAGAAAYTLKGPAAAAMAFDERLGLLANTAYAEYGKDGRKQGEAQIRQAVERAIGTGMTKDAAMDAVEKLVADNQVGGVAGALALLPYIGKVSTGSGSAGQEVAAMMGGFIGSGYARDVEGAKRLMGISSAAATAGAFEKNDMARHLPSLLPLAKAAGLTGEDGFRKLLVLLQQARTTAGTSDEAATNVSNLLAKLASNDTASDFKKAGRGDLYQHLMSQRAQGVDPLTAWQNVIDSEIARNPNLQPMIAKVKGATSKAEQDAAIEALTGMAEGQGIGRFFQDMQAKGALFGMRNGKVEAEVTKALRLSGTIVDTDYSLMAGKAGVQTRIARERMDMAGMTAMDSLTPAIGQAARALAELAAKHPLLIGATALATTALTALAGAAGMATVAMGGKVPGTGALGRAAGAVSGSATAAKVAKVAKVGGLAGAGALAGGLALDALAGEDSATARYGNKAMTGAALGATLGSVVPGAGTLAGGLIGGLGGLAWEGVNDVLKPAAPKPVDVNFKGQLDLAPGLVLKSQSMQASGGTVHMNTGNIHTGAP